MKQFFAVVISLLILSLSSSKAQTTSHIGYSIADQIYRETCSFNFRTVDSLISSNQKVHSLDLSYNLALVNYYWWKLISAESNKSYANLISGKIKNIELKYPVATIKIADPELFNLISIYAFKARVELKDYAYLAAINSLSRYYSFLKGSFGHENQFEPFLLTSGLYYFFAGLARDRYPIFAPILSHYQRGDILLGLYYLRKVSTSGDWKTRQEAEYFLMKIYFDIYKNYSESEKYCILLLNKYPNNLLYHQYLLTIRLASGQKQKAREELANIERLAYMNHQLSNNERDHYIKEARRELAKFTR